MADFYAARDNTMPPLPWPSIAPPFTGRKPTAMNKADAVLSLLSSGMSKAKVCEHVGISRASLYRIIKEAA